ncbi:MAG: winged helix-turn-helix domain-containing protein [Blastocatellia bacterium]
MDGPPSFTYSFGDFRLDTDKRLLLNRNGDSLPLMPKAYDTLNYLVEHAGETVDKGDLMSAVWPDTIVEENNLSQNISLLRKVLGEKPVDHRYIVTVPGRGFKFVADVRTDSISPSQDDRHERIVGDDLEPKDETQSGRIYWFALACAVIIVSALFFPSYNTGDSTSKGDISVTPLTIGEDVNGLTVSSDGKLIAYLADDGEHIRLMLQQTGQPIPIEVMSGLHMGEMTFSPDGRHIYFSSSEESNADLSVYRIATFGSEPRKILANVALESTVSFSPDGSDFVFVRINREINENSIVIARADGSGERVILRTGTENLKYPTWSPNGREIAFARYFTSQRPKEHYVTIDVVNLDDGTSRQLIEEKLDNCYRMAWTKGGSGLVFAGTKLGESMTSRRDQVWFASRSAQRLTRLTPEGDRYLFGGLTDDNAAFVSTVSRPSQIWKMDVSGSSRTAVQLSRGTTDGRTGIATLPDGRVGYTTRNGDDWEIWIMNGDGSGAVPAFNDNSTLEEIRATPDGKYFIFSGKAAGTNHLFRLGTNVSDIRQLTFGDEILVGDSSPSHDSAFVIYEENRFTDNNLTFSSIQRVSIDGGEPVQLSSAPLKVTSPHVSPDGKFISFIDQRRLPFGLAIMSLEDAADIKFFDTPKFALLNVGAVWTPDGKAVAYIVNKGKVSNIWLQSIEGGSPRQLTDFTSGRIYRLAFSRDGKHIYLARGYAKNNALLIKGFAD